MNLCGKNILITGGARRVGFAVAASLRGAGAAVYLHVNKSTPPEGYPAVRADFAVPGEADRLLAQLPRIDVLINNASMYQLNRLDSADLELDRQHFEVNFFAPLALMKAFAAQAGLTDGVIINFLDQEIFAPTPAGGAYALSRRALRDATLEMARLLGPRNIRVNGIAPGPVLPPAGLEESRMAKTLPTVPLGRKVELEDIAGTVKFIIANDSLTGVIIPVDCGQHCFRT